MPDPKYIPGICCIRVRRVCRRVLDILDQKGTQFLDVILRQLPKGLVLPKALISADNAVNHRDAEEAEDAESWMAVSGSLDCAKAREMFARCWPSGRQRRGR